MSQVGANNNNSKAVPEEIRKVLQSVIGTKQTIMSLALARIFTARSEGEWVYSNLQGILCLIWDREKENTPFLRLFDIETFDLLFEAEMYIDFNLSYASLTPLFYFFEYMSAFIGIQFASDSEANQFSVKVMTQSLQSKQMEQERAAQQPTQKEKKKEEKEGFLGIRQGAKKFFNNLFKKEGKHEGSEQQIQNCEISKPISVKKVTSLSYNIKTNQFDFSNLNEEWKSIFLRAGIQPSDLSNEQLAPIIFESVVRFQSHYDTIIENKQKDSRESKVPPKTDDRKQTTTNQNQNQKQNIPPPPVINQNLPPVPPNMNTVPSTNYSIPPPPPNMSIPPAPPMNSTIPNAPPLNIPPPPPITNIPVAPPMNITVDVRNTGVKNANFDSSQVMNKSSLLDQIKTGNFQLKRVEVNQKDNKAKLDVSEMDDKAQNDLSMYLSKCIAERRKQIRKHQYSSSDESQNSDDDDD